jgi:hypothetical protein
MVPFDAESIVAGVCTDGTGNVSFMVCCVVTATLTAPVGDGEGTGTGVVTGPVPAGCEQPARRIAKTTIVTRGIAFCSMVLGIFTLQYLK